MLFHCIKFHRTPKRLGEVALTRSMDRRSVKLCMGDIIRSMLPVFYASLTLIKFYIWVCVLCQITWINVTRRTIIHVIHVAYIHVLLLNYKGFQVSKLLRQADYQLSLDISVPWHWTQLGRNFLFSFTHRLYQPLIFFMQDHVDVNAHVLIPTNHLIVSKCHLKSNNTNIYKEMCKILLKGTFSDYRTFGL